MPVEIIKKPNGTVIRRRCKKGKAGGKGWWAESEKNNAVKVYLKEGTIVETCRQTGIPEDTLRKWCTTDWWREKLIAYNKESAQVLSGKLGKVLDKALAAVEERLDNGDMIYNPKTGKTTRIGVKASVANKITKDAIEKKVELDKIVAKDSTTDEAVSQRLNSLKDEFMKFIKSKTITQTIEVLDNEGIS